MKKILSIFALIAISFSSPTQAADCDLEGLFQGMGRHFRDLPDDTAKREFLCTSMVTSKEDIDWPTKVIERHVPISVMRDYAGKVKREPTNANDWALFHGHKLPYDVVAQYIPKGVLREHVPSVFVCDYVGEATLNSLKSRRWTPDSRQEYCTEYCKPLALAVACAQLELVQEFSSVVDDWNSEDYDSQGYRQPYTLAHVVLDPYNLSFRGPLDQSVEMLRFLGNRGIDFTLVRRSQHYTNPPLASGTSRGNHENWRICVLRGAALEFLPDALSADNYPKGSSFTLTEGALESARRAIAQYEELPVKNSQLLEELGRMSAHAEQEIEERITRFNREHNAAQRIQAAYKAHKARRQVEIEGMKAAEEAINKAMAAVREKMLPPS